MRLSAGSPAPLDRLIGLLASVLVVVVLAGLLALVVKLL